MSVLEVVFEIPDHIIEGLENGSFERRFGVIRETASKQIVAWLHEVNLGEDQQLSESASQMANKLGIISEASNTIVSLNLINIAITAGGFMFIANKINKVQDKLNEISIEIVEMKIAIKNIGQRQDLEQYAKVKSAINIASRALSLTNEEHRIEDLRDARKQFTSSRNIFHLIIEEMINKGLVWKYFDSFYIYTVMLFYCILAEAKCGLYLGEDNIVRDELVSYRKEFMTITKPFMTQFSPFNSDFIKIHSNRIPELNMMRKQVAECNNFLEGMHDELNFLEQNVLPYHAMEEMINLKGPKSGLALLLPVEE